jgi:dienelactone hydrolase
VTAPSTHTTRRAFLGTAAAGAVSTVLASDANAVITPDRDQPAVFRPLLDDIHTPEQFAKKRKSIVATIERYLGKATPFEAVEAKARILSETRTDDYRQLKIAYNVEPDEEVRAWLLMPPKEKRLKNAAVLTLHGTATEAKDSQIGASTKSNRDFGRFLAQQGFVTLSPDHCCSGERLKPGFKPYDSAPFYERHPEWSMVGKAIYDGQRALDVLQQFEEVDPTRLGVAGHSLGGHGAMYVAAFDERLKVAVNSCGLTTWTGNPQRTHWARTGWYIYYKPLQKIMRDPSGAVPFEMYDFAALIAPRSYLNISGMGDKTYGITATLPQVGLELQRLYDLLGASNQFANFLFGDAHDVPDYSRDLTISWIRSVLG